MMRSSSTIRIRAVAMRISSGLWGQYWERQRKSRPTGALERNRPIELLGEHNNELEAQSFGMAEVEAGREPDPGIMHHQPRLLRCDAAQLYVNDAGVARRKGVLEGIGQQLIENEP